MTWQLRTGIRACECKQHRAAKENTMDKDYSAQNPYEPHLKKLRAELAALSAAATAKPTTPTPTVVDAVATNNFVPPNPYSEVLK